MGLERLRRSAAAGAAAARRAVAAGLVSILTLVAPAAMALAGCSGSDGAAPGGAAAQAGALQAPAPGTPGVVIEWWRRAEPQEHGSIGAGGLWLGTLSGPRAHYLFARRRFAEDLALFARTYASFRSPGPGPIEISFRGAGGTAASDAERRMILAWSRRAAAEAVAGAAGVGRSPFGLALSWHRGAANGGSCQDLTVYSSGEVRAGACAGSPEASGRLDREQIERLYGWLDALRPFQSADEGVLADAEIERILFAGNGRRQAGVSEIAAVTAFAGALNRQVRTAGTAAGPSGGPVPGGTAALPAGAGEERSRAAIAPALAAVRPPPPPAPPPSRAASPAPAEPPPADPPAAEPPPPAGRSVGA